MKTTKKPAKKNIGDDCDDRPFDGIVRDPSKPDYVLLPPLGMTLAPATDDLWSRRAARK